MLEKYQSPDLFYYRAIVDLNASDLTNALKNCRTSLNLQEEIGVRHLLGAILHDLGDYNQSLTEFEKVEAKRPDLTWNYFRHGRTLNKLGRHADAIPRLKKAKENDPPYIEVYVELVSAFIRLEHWDDVISACSQGLDLDLENAFLYYYKGVAETRIDKFADAQKDFILCLKYQRHATTAANIALCYTQVDRFADALAFYQICLTIDHTLFYVHRELALLYYKLKDNELAFYQYELLFERGHPELSDYSQAAKPKLPSRFIIMRRPSDTLVSPSIVTMRKNDSQRYIFAAPAILRLEKTT